MNELENSIDYSHQPSPKKPNVPLSSAEKLSIFEDYLKEEQSITQLASKYGRGLSTVSSIISTFVAELESRPEASRPEALAAPAANANPTSNEDIFMGKERELKLAHQVKELQAQLKQQEKCLEHERLGHLFYKTMVDIAEKELHLDIRKKFGAKQ